MARPARRGELKGGRAAPRSASVRARRPGSSKLARPSRRIANVEVPGAFLEMEAAPRSIERGAYLDQALLLSIMRLSVGGTWLWSETEAQVEIPINFLKC